MDKLTIDPITNTIICGNSQDILLLFPSDSIQVCITSPPYWGLRDYGLEPVLWDGNIECEHEWGDEYRKSMSGGIATGVVGSHQDDRTHFNNTSQFCQKCGCWKGTLGLEPTPELYIRHLVDIFNEVKRILRPDGTCWVNIGDSYNAGRNGGHPGGTKQWHIEDGKYPHRSGVNAPGVKPKDLCLIPFRLAIALQEAGWWVRSDIIWAKPNPMPESVTDRPTKSHEYIFMLAKSQKYYYDADAIREKKNEPIRMAKSFRDGGVYTNNRSFQNNNSKEKQTHGDGEPSYNGRNKRDVWTITTQPYPEAHFATFPPEIPEICIKAGSKPNDIVLDIFAGSGTTCATAKSLDRKYIGIEANPEYIKLAEKRIVGAVYQPSLLDGRAECG